MTRTPRVELLLVTLLLTFASTGFGQGASDTSRDKTRTRLSGLLAREGPNVKVDFQPSEKTQYLFVGTLRDGLKNADSMEILISVTPSETINVRVFPHYRKALINVDKARSSTQLLRKVAQLNDKTFLFWGVTDAGDVFTGYTFTLESGFPDEAIKVVLSSIKNSDQFVGEMRPAIDGSTAQ